MGTDVIQVYARLKPERDRDHVTSYRIHRRVKDDTEEDFLILQASLKQDEYVDHRPESWNFSFHRIIDEKANQRDVFEDVGRPVIESVLDGYNGTIFAYGQTGSGKTYSITGGRRADDSDGIIPRTLRYLFNVIKMHPENVYSVDVAYLEIYNEYGYDLLDRKQVQQQQALRLEDLPRVIIQEDEKGRLHLKNLTFHNVKSEDQAMELFFLGDSRRITAETPMNPQSSRSHCILTIVVSVKQLGANRYKKAKMHLVDLAGSERVYKCAINGTILNEAKHINLSLHYLEQVIVCLGQESTGHIPYRNCLLTAILRDSLGGNCVTRMLATLSVSSMNLMETISTCRFAQRVALVRNDAKLVMEHDVDSENTLLKLENEKLRKQVEELTIQNENLKNMLPIKDSENDAVEKLDYYKNLVEQRDKEISVLINLLKKAKVKKDKVKINEEKNKRSLETEKISGDSKNDLQIVRADNDRSKICFTNELNRSESTLDLKNDRVDKILETNKVEKVLVNDKIDKIMKTNKVDITPETNKVEKALENDKIDKIMKTNKVDITLETNKVDEALETDKIDKITKTNKVNKILKTTEDDKILKINEIDKILKTNEIDKIFKTNEIDQVLKTNKVDEILETNPSKIETLKSEENSVTKGIDQALRNNTIPSPKLHSNRIMENHFPELIMNDTLIRNSIVDNDQSMNLKKSVEYDKDDHDFEKNLPLTGDPEIDEEIVAFYKAKRTGGVY